MTRNTQSPSISSSVEAFAHRLNQEARVLDVGCGLRPYETFFSHCWYVGIDAWQSGRTADSKHPDVFFDGRHFPIASERFDAVICTEVLEHAEDPEALVNEIYRVLIKGGIFFLTVPFMWGEHEAPYDFRRFSTFGTQQLLRKANFRLISTDKLTQGIEAVAGIVRSEINNYQMNSNQRHPNTARYRLLDWISQRWWRTQLQLWKSLYQFERVYLDSAVIGIKE